MKLPKRLRVGYRWYAVQDWDHHTANAAHCFGNCDRDAAVIRVDTSYGPDKAANTFLHEALHAVWQERRLPAKAIEEAAVVGLADGLCTLARDNPEAIQAWLDVMRATT